MRARLAPQEEWHRRVLPRDQLGARLRALPPPEDEDEEDGEDEEDEEEDQGEEEEDKEEEKEKKKEKEKEKEKEEEEDEEPGRRTREVVRYRLDLTALVIRAATTRPHLATQHAAGGERSQAWWPWPTRAFDAPFWRFILAHPAGHTPRRATERPT
jgi:Mg-chelatase subunit ChlI